MMIVTSLAVAAALAASPATSAPTTAQVLPTRFEAGHIYLVPETLSHQHLRLLADTGGGYAITSETAQRLNLKVRQQTIDGSKMDVADWPDFKAGQGFPAHPSLGRTVPVSPASQDFIGADGTIGGPIFGGHTWTFDYPGERLTLQGTDWQPDAHARSTPLGFQKNDQGQVVGAYPRIIMRVDGQPVDMLLDTGATAHPSAAGEKASGTPTVNGIGVTSYITTNVLERWHKAHPDWRIVENGDDLGGAKHSERLIEVPKVEIAGWSVGPVWFTERSDRAFHDYMSSYMDKQVEGSVGGNVFGHFVMTLDYPHSTAYFSCVRGCVAATPPPAP